MDDLLPEVVCVQVKTVLAKALAVISGDEEARILELFLTKALNQLPQGLVGVADPCIVERPHNTTMLVGVIVVFLPHDLGSFLWEQDGRGTSPQGAAVQNRSACGRGHPPRIGR